MEKNVADELFGCQCLLAKGIPREKRKKSSQNDEKGESLHIIISFSHIFEGKKVASLFM